MPGHAPAAHAGGGPDRYLDEHRAPVPGGELGAGRQHSGLGLWEADLGQGGVGRELVLNWGECVARPGTRTSSTTTSMATRTRACGSRSIPSTAPRPSSSSAEPTAARGRCHTPFSMIGQRGSRRAAWPSCPTSTPNPIAGEWSAGSSNQVTRILQHVDRAGRRRRVRADSTACPVRADARR
jgi:hypothetical protein